MINPFSAKYMADADDSELVARAKQGDREALESLIIRHQSWIYNIALRMVGDPQDAEDVTQEIIIKLITRLSTFRGDSAFNTWLYRIVANHVINMKTKPAEKICKSFESYGKAIDELPDMPLPAQNTMPVEMPLIIAETRIGCMIGMLLCLDREPRLAFILGSIFGVNDRIGSQVMNINRDNFRQKLSRGRRKIANFMNEKCGLINEKNACHCDRKTGSLIKSGFINPQKLVFSSAEMRRIKSVARTRLEKLDDFLESKCRRLYRDDPFQISPDFVPSLRKIIQRDEFRKLMNLSQ